MSLTARARDARVRADATGDPSDEALADALEAAEAAECQRALEGIGVDRSAAGISTPQEAGFMSAVKLPPGQGAN